MEDPVKPEAKHPVVCFTAEVGVVRGPGLPLSHYEASLVRGALLASIRVLYCLELDRFLESRPRFSTRTPTFALTVPLTCLVLSNFFARLPLTFRSYDSASQPFTPACLPHPCPL